MLTRARWLPCGHAVTLLAELGQSREEILPIRVGQASEMPESPPALGPLGRGFTASHHDGEFSPFSPGLVQRRARTAEPTARRSQLIPEFLPWCLLESGYPPCNTNSCFTARAAWRGEFSLSPSIPASCSLDWWVVRKICSSALSAIWEPRQSPVDREPKAVPQRTKPTSPLERWESLCLRALKMQISARVGSSG